MKRFGIPVIFLCLLSSLAISNSRADEADKKATTEAKSSASEAKKKEQAAQKRAEAKAIIKLYRERAARSTRGISGGGTAEGTVNRLLGVSANPSGISPKPSSYIYQPRTKPANYGDIYGRPNYSQYRSLNSRLRDSQRSRYPSVYQHPSATNIFAPRRIGIR